MASVKMTRAGGEVDPERRLGELVAERPARARLFERLHLDYCCGGQQTLVEACAKQSLELGSVRAAIAALDEAASEPDGCELTDWRSVPIEQLCEHIVSAHHDALRQAFPRVDTLMATVIRVHGDADPRLQEVEHAYGRIRSALEPHLGSEETDLFPAIVAAAHGGAPVPASTLTEHEHEHADVGAALARLRVLCHDYERPRAHCNTHRALLDALEDLELDLHRHVHEENNILFARAREAHAPAEDTGSAGSRRADTPPEAAQPLPSCCQGWIAEQSHRWAAHRR
ncbi:MAG TPA: iron-sulfur cluster repair di-iron protein [Solirubrobacteraceae bacterium]|nr:iron-sulfur cluster repair di-iron protein [Solirubrobacteraceae bacterium]